MTPDEFAMLRQVEQKLSDVTALVRAWRCIVMPPEMRHCDVCGAVIGPDNPAGVSTSSYVYCTECATHGAPLRRT